MKREDLQKANKLEDDIKYYEEILKALNDDEAFITVNISHKSFGVYDKRLFDFEEKYENMREDIIKTYQDIYEQKLKELEAL